MKIQKNCLFLPHESIVAIAYKSIATNAAVTMPTHPTSHRDPPLITLSFGMLGFEFLVVAYPNASNPVSSSGPIGPPPAISPPLAFWITICIETPRS